MSSLQSKSELVPVENLDNKCTIRFENALRQIMQVSKEDLKKIADEEEAEKADKPKRGPKRKNFNTSTKVMKVCDKQ